MSTPFNPTLVVTRKCNSDISSSSYCLVKAVGDDDIDIPSEGQLVIGALTNDDAKGTASAPVSVAVQMGGMIKVQVDGSGVTAGTLCMADASGNAKTVTSGKYAFGIALETHAAGDVGAFLFAPSYYEEG